MRSLTLTAAFALLLGLAPLSQANDSYVRFQSGDSQRDAAMQTAVAHFTNPDSKVEIILYGVVHIADAGYYARVQRDLDSYDVVLFEGVAPGKTQLTEEDKGLGELQKMMGEMLGLTFQKDGIDYTRSNLVHADMNMDQLKEAMGGQSLNPMGGIMGGDQMKALAPMLKMFSGAESTNGSSFSPVLRTPIWGSVNSIQPMVTAMLGIMNAIQNMNSIPWLNGILVRAMIQAISTASGKLMLVLRKKIMTVFHSGNSSQPGC